MVVVVVVWCGGVVVRWCLVVMMCAGAGAGAGVVAGVCTGAVLLS